MGETGGGVGTGGTHRGRRGRRWVRVGAMRTPY